MTFESFNFKLSVIESLRKLGYFETEWSKLLEKHWREDNFSYKPIPEILRFCKQLNLTESMLNEVRILEFDGGCQIYADIIPNWDGEDDFFDIKNIKDVLKLKNLEEFHEISILNIKDYTPLLKLKNLRVASNLSCDEFMKKLLIDSGIKLSRTIDSYEEDEDQFFIHFNKAKDYEDENKYDLAIKEHKLALKYNNHYLPYYHIGCLKIKTENPKEAIEWFTKAIDINTKYSRALKDRAKAHLLVKNFKQALVDVNQAIELNAKYGFPEAEKLKEKILSIQKDQ